MELMHVVHDVGTVTAANYSSRLDSTHFKLETPAKLHEDHDTSIENSCTMYVQSGLHQQTPP
jgi:hypothetical protein